MGLLSEGTPLSWPESSPFRHRVRKDGITQFLHIYHSAKNYQNHELKWGDEVEYILLHLDSSRRKSTLSLSAPRILPILQQEEHDNDQKHNPTMWHPEYATWMLEGTPGIPYRSYAADLVNVERNMALRRTQIMNVIRSAEDPYCTSVLTLSTFPRLGVATHTNPETLPYGPVARSFHTSDNAINPHPRFPTLTRNIRQRRGSNVRISLPLFIDKHTNPIQPLISPEPAHRKLLNQVASMPAALGGLTSHELNVLRTAEKATVDKAVVMDSSAFGMGSCCLQVTLQGRDMDESRHLYDQLAVVAPLMLALTAATPAVRGMLVDTDVRWDIISAAMDDRTLDEISTKTVPKSRYSSIDCFLSSRDEFNPADYNDLPTPIHKESYNRLKESGVDELLAQHIAHLYIREPLVVYEEKIEQDNTTSTDHFENIQSTNWNTVRFKLPPPGTDIGWRTEFRPMEVGLTDFENAAFSVFTIILSRVILAFNLDFYVPMSKVDENMRTAHKRDAVRSGLFAFRGNIFNRSGGADFLCDCGHIHNAHLIGAYAGCDDNIDNICRREVCDNTESRLMTIDEIFNGKPMCRNGQQQGFQFPGLIPLMRGYLDALKIDEETSCQLITYLDFISDRASGKLCTNAAYIRKFISEHKAYNQNSIVNDEICYDLMKHLEAITNREIEAPELLGDFYRKSLSSQSKETSNSMLNLMQNEPVGERARQLEASAMPNVLRDTIVSLASERDDDRCCC